MKKYGKPSGDIVKLKKSFFDENKIKLEEAKKYAFAYANQPVRRNCKICEEPLPQPFFYKLGVGYSFCEKCGQLCGIYEDTDGFCREIYTDNSGKNYARNYYEHDRFNYTKRVKSIYLPKAEFLICSLKNEGVDARSSKFVELGAGSGYFVAAMLRLGVDSIKGYEVSEFQVNYGNDMLQKKLLETNKPNELVSIIQDSEAGIISMIGVMEHFQNPMEILQAIKKNKNIKYIYFCVPMFSFSVFLEKVFEGNVMPRHLTGGHTHLFTEKSLSYIEQQFSFCRVSEWWFGSDIMDLYRSFYVSLKSSETKSRMEAQWKDYFLDEIDSIQIVLDKKHKSSQVHMLWKVC